MGLIERIILMIFAEPLEPYIELIIIYIIGKYLYDRFKEYDFKISIEKDVEKIKDLIK